MYTIDVLNKWITHDDVELVDFVLKHINTRGIGNLETTHLLLERYNQLKTDNHQVNLLFHLTKLPLDGDALKVIDQFNQPGNEQFYRERLIMEADLTLLAKHPQIQPKVAQFQGLLHLRKQIHQQSTSQLWEDLWKLCQLLVDEPDKHQHQMGFFIINELVTRDNFPQVELEKEIEKHNQSKEYQYWHQVLLSYLIGAYRYKEGIPYLIKTFENNLKNFDSLLNEIIGTSLIQLGDASTVEWIDKKYSKASKEDQEEFSMILEQIMIPEAEQLLIKLFKSEKDNYSKTVLASILCEFLSKDAIPLIAELIKKGYDDSYTILEQKLIWNCIINGVNHEDIPLWKKQLKERNRLHEEKWGAFSNQFFK